jgi:biopolymer transport protein ExbB/TolQ
MRSRASAMRAALLFGFPLAGVILLPVQSGLFPGTLLERYLSHPVEWVEVLLFCWALALLGLKYLQALAERRATRFPVLPAWNGETAPVSEAARLLEDVDRLPARRRGSWFVNRVRAVLDFVRSRNSAAELDDQIRALADNDAMAVENSYSLLRFICWAIPILGFLGTVLGITEAVAGVTPEKLEESLDQVTGGLAVAFDTTALALALTMILMFLSYVTEQAESGVLLAVDGYVERELAHRFERLAGEGGKLAQAVRQDVQALVTAAEQLVQRQAEVWSRTIAQIENRHAAAEKQQQERLLAALEGALQRTLQSHAQQLAALEKQTLERGSGLLEQLAHVGTAVRAAGQEQCEALAQVADRIAVQADVLGRLQDGERQLVQLQELLNQNLSAIAGVSTFEQAVHSLTAAVHMLSAAAVQGQARAPLRRAAAPEDGKAA